MQLHRLLVVLYALQGQVSMLLGHADRKVINVFDLF